MSITSKQEQDFLSFHVREQGEIMIWIGKALGSCIRYLLSLYITQLYDAVARVRLRMLVVI